MTPKQLARKVFVNDEAFAVLNDESLYWLGFLLADGSVYLKSSGGRFDGFSVGLTQRDRGHLESLKAFLRSTAKITDYARTRSCTFTCRSHQIATDLNRWGVTPRKSMTATVHPDFSDSIPFFRGLVDGDGCLTWTMLKEARYGKTPRLNLVGTRVVCQSFLDFIKRRLPETDQERQVKPHVKIFVVEWNGQDAANIANLLYQSEGPALPRKVEKRHEFNDFLVHRKEIESARSLLYSRAEVGRLVGEPHEYLYLWEKFRGVIPGRVGTGFDTGYLRTEIDAWLANGIPQFRKIRGGAGK